MPRLRDAATLLAAWEGAAPLPDVARPATLVAHDGGGPVDAVLDLPLATCASLALAAHIDAFGAQAECCCDCTACGAAIDVLLDLREFQAITCGADPDGEIVTVGGGAQSLAVRALTTRDLLDTARTADPALALRQRCLRDENGQALSTTDLGALSADDLAAVDAAADRLAGPASILLRMRCPDCGEDTSASVDLGALLWERVSAEAPRLLAEVAALARAFGWSEDAVLALGAARRRAYLELAGAFSEAPGWAAVST
jgi:hypothetical protein